MTRFSFFVDAINIDLKNATTTKKAKHVIGGGVSGYLCGYAWA